MQQTPHTLSLDHILQHSQQKMQQLVQLLQQETEALRQNDIALLETIAPQKQQLAADIEAAEQQRVQHLQKRTLDPQQPRQWLKSKTEKACWKKLRQLAEQAHRQNQINGLVINGNRQRIQAQIEILCNAKPGNDLVYSANGKNIRQNDSNTLGQV